MTCKCRTLSVEELLLAKLLALLHDPPWKHLVVSKALQGHDPVEYIGNRCAARLSPLTCDVICAKNIQKSHEKQAAKFAAAVLEIIQSAAGIDLADMAASRVSLYQVLAKRADMLASSFDRIAAGYANEIYKMYKKRENTVLESPVIYGLFNIHGPEVSAARGMPPSSRRAAERIGEAVKGFLDNLHKALRSRGSLSMRHIYHLFSLLYEPLWYTSFLSEEPHGYVPRWVWGPADTRVPHHSVFDHLYASAAAVNMLPVCGTTSNDSESCEVYGGFFVYVGLRGLKDWIGSSRKLSDSWLASWLASVIVWYAVKDIVWCLGPDVLLVPGFRWNQLYLSLLWEKLGIEGIGDPEDPVVKVARSYYFWRGYPYYAWQPAFAVLLLPLAVKADSGGDVCGELLNEIFANDIDCYDENKMRSVLSQSAGRIRELLEDKFREAWRRAVEAVVEELRRCDRDEGRCHRGHLAMVIADALEHLVADIPPMEPLVRVFPIVFCQHTIRHQSGKNKSTRLVIVAGEKVYADKKSVKACSEFVSEELGVDKEKAMDICRQRSYIGRGRYISITASKILYAFGYNRLMSLVEEAKASHSTPGWARLSEERPRQLEAWYRRLSRCAGREAPGAPGKWWENCSVCRRGVALLRVPGRDLPGGGVSEDYAEFAEKLGCGSEEECWRVWRPVFAPGERLCPHCLVKRLAGLNEFYRAVGEALLGYEPPHREVAFPSTGDVAALATKLALLRLARRFIEGSIGGLGSWFHDMAEAVSGVRYRSSVVNEAAKVLKGLASGGNVGLEEAERAVWEVVRGRFWAPRILYVEARRLAEEVRKARKEDRLDTDRAVAALAALLGAHLEFYDIPIVSEKGSGFYRSLRGLAEEVKNSSLDGQEKNALIEALKRPRLYYALLSFDVDKGSLINRGLLLDGRGNYRDAKDYLAAMALSLCRLLIKCKRSNIESTWFLARYLHSLGFSGLKDGDNLLIAADEMGTLLVTPSLHYAVSSSLAYTLLRAAVVAERLGGIPVYMGGDEGRVFLPAWLPWSFTAGNTVKYRREVARAAYMPELEVATASSPAMVYAVLLRRIFWASSASAPGFHPVKPGGRGRTVTRIAAVVSNGLSIGLHYAHHRDHLYTVTAASEILLEHAKARGGKDSNDEGSKRDALAVSFGRLVAPRPHEALEAAPVLPHVEQGDERVTSAARLPAIAALLAGLVESGYASKTLPRGLDVIAPGGTRFPQLASGSMKLLKGIARVLSERYVEDQRLEGTTLTARDVVYRLLASVPANELASVLRAALIVSEASSRSSHSSH